MIAKSNYKIIVSFLIINFTSPTILAQIYENATNTGNMSFSDTPSVNAKPVTVNELSSNTSINITTPVTTNSPSNATSLPNQNTPPSSASSNTSRNYSEFNLVSPINEQTFQNQREILLQFTLKPNLQKGDAIVVDIDGKLYSKEMKPTMIIQNLDRGTHQIEAKIIDDSGKVLKSISPITIYIHYASISNNSK